MEILLSIHRVEALLLVPKKNVVTLAVYLYRYSVSTEYLNLLLAKISRLFVILIRVQYYRFIFLNGMTMLSISFILILFYIIIFLCDQLHNLM